MQARLEHDPAMMRVFVIFRISFFNTWGGYSMRIIHGSRRSLHFCDADGKAGVSQSCQSANDKRVVGRTASKLRGGAAEESRQCVAFWNEGREMAAGGRAGCSLFSAAGAAPGPRPSRTGRRTSARPVPSPGSRATSAR